MGLPYCWLTSFSCHRCWSDCTTYYSTGTTPNQRMPESTIYRNYQLDSEFLWKATQDYANENHPEGMRKMKLGKAAFPKPPRLSPPAKRVRKCASILGWHCDAGCDAV